MTYKSALPILPSKESKFLSINLIRDAVYNGYIEKGFHFRAVGGELAKYIVRQALAAEIGEEAAQAAITVAYDEYAHVIRLSKLYAELKRNQDSKTVHAAMTRVVAPYGFALDEDGNFMAQRADAKLPAFLSSAPATMSDGGGAAEPLDKEPLSMQEAHGSYDELNGAVSKAEENFPAEWAALDFEQLRALAHDKQTPFDVVEGIRLYRYILTRYPNHPLAMKDLAYYLWQRGEYREAAELIKACRRLQPSTVQPWYEEKILMAGKAADAVETLERAGKSVNVIPDGKGGVTVDTFGFAGKWLLSFEADCAPASSGRMLSITKSVATLLPAPTHTSLVKIGTTAVNEPTRIVVFNNLATVAFPHNGCYGAFSSADADSPQVIVQYADENKMRPQTIYVHERIVAREHDDQRAFLAQAFAALVPYTPQANLAEKSGLEIPAVRSNQIGFIGSNETARFGVKLLSGILHEAGFAVHEYDITDETRDYKLGMAGTPFSSCTRSEILPEYRAQFRSVIQRIRQDRIGVVCLSVFTMMIPKMCLFIEELKRAIPDIVVIVGGPAAHTVEQLAALMPQADVVVRGEGDDILPQIMRIYTDPKCAPAERVVQLAALSGGVYVRGNTFLLANNLDTENQAARITLPTPTDPKKDKYLFTSRGCPYDCTFCNRVFGKDFRVAGDDDVLGWLFARIALKMPGKTAQDVKTLLESHVNLFQAGLVQPFHIEIWDDNFLMHRERVIRLARRMADLHIGDYVQFSVEGGSIRALLRGQNKRIDSALIDALWAAYIREIRFGTDGLAPGVLAMHRKGYTFDDVMAVSAYLEQKGFIVKHNLILTTPFTTPQEYIENYMLYRAFPSYHFSQINQGIIADQTTEITARTLIVEEASETYWDAPGSGLYNWDSNYWLPAERIYALRAYTSLPSMFNVPRNVQSLREDDLDDLMKDPWRFSRLESGINTRIVAGWRASSSPQLRALAGVLDFSRCDVTAIDKLQTEIRRIKDDMRMRGIFTFSEYEAFLKSQPREMSADELLAQGLTFISAGLIGSAIVRFAQMQERYPHDVRGYYYSIAHFIRIGSYAYAARGIMGLFKTEQLPLPVFFRTHDRRFGVALTELLYAAYAGMVLPSDNLIQREIQYAAPGSVGVVFATCLGIIQKNIEIVLHTLTRTEPLSHAAFTSFPAKKCITYPFTES